MIVMSLIHVMTYLIMVAMHKGDAFEIPVNFIQRQRRMATLPALEATQVASEAGGPRREAQRPEDLSRAADREDILIHFCFLSEK